MGNKEIQRKMEKLRGRRRTAELPTSIEYRFACVHSLKRRKYGTLDVMKQETMFAMGIIRECLRESIFVTIQVDNR